jgi:LCP family protein required for cell wall assembly
MALKPPGTYPDGAPAPDGDGALPAANPDRSLLEQAVHHEQNRRFRRFVRRASLGSLVPGIGLLMAGRRLSGGIVLGAFLVLVSAVVLALSGLTSTDLVALAVDPRFLAASAGALALLALALLVNAAVSHHVLQPDSIRRTQRLTAAVIVTLVSSLVVAPLAMASRYAIVQYELVTNVFVADAGEQEVESRSGDSARDPRPYEDPWADVDRVNVLLIGSDAGPGREGTRPDTNIVASVDPATGDTVLFSLPRNLANVPFPVDSPLSDYYPWGWQGQPGDVGSELLNAIYRYVPAAHPDLFTDVDDPGAEAMKLAAEGVTGLPIDYYVMVDLDGFQQVVDALGGIDITVSQRIPLESSMLPAGYCSEPTYYLEPGRQRLNGYEALWYARVRCGGEGLSDDYDRMRRQRCVIGAMIDRADPLTVLRRYESLAGTARRIVSTDIPQEMVPAFAELALRVQSGQVRTLPFTDKVIYTGSPDYAFMRQLVDEALAPPPPATNDPTDAPAGGGGSDAAPDSGSGGSDTGSSGATVSPDSTLEPQPQDESDGVLNLDDVC